MDENELNASFNEEKQVIVNKLVNTGINITPEMLELVLKLEKPLEKIKILIKETSFIPTFQSHLTAEILRKINEEEIQKALKRTISEDFSHGLEEKKEKKVEKSKKAKISSLSEKTNEVKPKEKIKVKSLPKLKTSVKLDNKVVPQTSNTFQSSKAPIEKKAERSSIGTTRSIFYFNPIAKEYSSEYEILKDPTGKIHTNGDYQDFYDLTLDKYTKLHKLMKKRPEAISATKISNILRNSQDQHISVIGLVNEIRETKKGNYFITIEDLTGVINAIVRKDTDNPDNLRIVERLIKDQMVCIEGTYHPGQDNSKGIIFSDTISKIDIRNDFEPSISPDPVSIALISDIHIASKEFESKLWKKFIDFINGRVDNKSLRDSAGKIKYIVINGDLVDGVGIYPHQEDDLVIKDIFQQYKKAADLLSDIPDYIKIFYSSGNHEPVRNAIPRPAVPKKYASDLMDIGVKCIGNPSLIKTHGVSTLIYHGDSMLDMSLLVAGLENEKPIETMKEFLLCRHLAPIFGKRTQIAPISKDWLVIDKIPDIFHTGHIHINGFDKYKNISLVNSGCFQAQTDFMKSFGIVPTPGIVPIIELDTYKNIEIDFKHI